MYSNDLHVHKRTMIVLKTIDQPPKIYNQVKEACEVVVIVCRIGSLYSHLMYHRVSAAGYCGTPLITLYMQ